MMMKIVVINSSPRGKLSNTNVMVSAFLKGAKTAGAETVNIFLAEKEIKHCKGCHACWIKGPNQCVIYDDMQGILECMGTANIIVFATPVYFSNISGMLKVFMDRMTMIGSPHAPTYSNEESKELQAFKRQAPKLLIISNCGLPDRDEFQVVSLWIKKVAQKTQMELVGEIYTTQGKNLTSPPEKFQAKLSEYLLLLEKAGKEIATNMRLSADTIKKLMENFFQSNNAK
jgi:Multimeric flavodoxin WrbA